MADQAWARLVALAQVERGLRIPGLPPNYRDPVEERWLASSKSQFVSAWGHVASMADPDAIRNDYAAFLTHTSKETVRRTVEALKVDVAGVLRVLRSDEGARTFKPAISAIEGVLVACMGHYAPRVRAHAVKMLNALYDGVDWQLYAPLPPVMAQVEDVAGLDLYTAHPLTLADAGEEFRVLMSAPPFDRAAAGSGIDHILTMHVPVVEEELVWARLPLGTGESATSPGGGVVPPAAAASLEEKAVASATSPDGSCRYVRLRAYRVRLSFGAFTRCGFFDWRLVAVSSSGVCRPVAQLCPVGGHELSHLIAMGVLPPEGSNPLSPVGVSMAPVPLGNARIVAPAGASAASPGGAGGPPPLDSALPLTLGQGRWIVHRGGITEENIHEVVVDLEGMKFSESGEIIRHGTFADVGANLRTMRGSGVTSLYVMGAIERDNGWGDAEPADGGALAGAASPGRVPNSARTSTEDGSASGGGEASYARLRAGSTGGAPAGEYLPAQGLSGAGRGGLGGQAHHPSSESVADSDFGFFSLEAEGGLGGGVAGLGGMLSSSGDGGIGLGGSASTGLLGAPVQVTAGVSVADATGNLGATLQVAPASTGGGGSSGEPTPGVRAYATRPDANPHAVVDRHTPNRMLGGYAGLWRLCNDARGLGMRVMVQLDAAISASRPHRKYRSLYARTLDAKGQAVIHHGTDALENQWEDTQLLNYRKVEAWELLVSEAKTLVQNFGVGGLVLSDAQSYPFVMGLDASELMRRDVDGEMHYSPREILEGEVVIANTEVGYWTTKAARSYANPLLVKLTRALWAIAPDFTVAGDSHWGRAGALQRSGVIPRSLDIVSAMASTIGRHVDKNGTITPFSMPGNVQPVHFLRALVAGENGGVVPPQAAPNFVQSQLHSGAFPSPLTGLLEGPGGPMPRGGSPLQLRALSSARLPYPALLLGRSAWTGVDLLYSLPGVPTTFGEERSGRAYRVDVAGTYTYNPAYLEEEQKKREKRLAAERAVARSRGGSSRGLPSSGQPSAAVTTAGPPRPLGGLGSRPSSYGHALDQLAASAPSSFASQALPHSLQSQAGGMVSFPPTAVTATSSGLGGGTSGAFDYLLPMEGDLGVGGVVPAMPVRGAPSYKISRTGFSHLNLASLATLGEEPPSATSSSPLTTHHAGSSILHPLGIAGTASSSSSHSPDRYHAHSTAQVSPRTGFGHPQLPPSVFLGSRAGAPGSGGGMMRAGSSPALQSLLLLSAQSEVLGPEGGTPTAYLAATGDLGAAAGQVFAFGAPPAGSLSDRGAPIAEGDEMREEAGDEDEDDDDEEEEEEATPGATAGFAALSLEERQLEAPSGFGFHVPTLAGAPAAPGVAGKPPRSRSGGSKLRESWGMSEAAGGAGAGGGTSEGGLLSAPTTVTGQEAASISSSKDGGSFRLGQRSPTKAPRPSSSASGGASEITRVTSWAALDSMTFKGGDGMGLGSGGHALRDSLRQLAAMEARLRQEVGPQYGFDLAQIGAHYNHRRLLRARYPVLREGDLTVLTALHRYGEHGHVFSFARTLPGQVAVVAANFNGHPSTFTVDCTPLVPALGAATTADASASVAQLMSSSVAVGEAVRERLASGAPAASSVPGRPTSLFLPPSLNLKGGVWEVRDVFASDGRRTATAGLFRGASDFSEGDGPLIGIMTSEEAAYAPMLSTLAPHRSYCWLYVAATGSSSQGLLRTPVAGTGPTAGSGFMQVLDRDAETDSAAMQWLFASSLLRLQSVMRLKECGLASAIVTRSEVAAAGGSLTAVLASRKLGSGEPWISPGEALKDSEIQSAARHNLVYSLLRHVVKRCYRALAAARRDAAQGQGLEWDLVSNPDAARSAPGPTREALSSVIAQTALYLEAALRVLVTHWRLRPAPQQPGRAEPPHLVAEPLPSLHGAMNRGAAEYSGQGGTEAAWYAVDGEAAVVIARTALFLAVKDVVAQAASGKTGATAASTSSAGAEGDADVSDEDATISALLIKGLVRIARGRTSAGAARGVPRDHPSGAGDAAGVEQSVVAFAHRLLWRNSAAPIVFVTPELGKWSTVGGLGVMVDELSVGLAELGLDVVCVSPYYNVNRKGVSDYLRADGITYTGRNVGVWVGPERIEMGVHEGRVNGVRVFFLHNGDVFPRPYPSHDAFNQVRVLSAFARGTLELLCQWRLIPQTVVTNDWFTGLVPAYARHGHFGDAFQRTDFMHIAHNLDPDYEGRLWPQPAQGTLSHLHGLPSHLLVDPHWHDVVVNPTRAALMCSDTWATVSRSYRADLLGSSPLRGLLRLAPHPFAHPNGIPVKARLARLASLSHPTHEEAKMALQRKYFGYAQGDLSIPLFAFVGRITLQKGVHLILQAVDELLRATNGRALFLVGGMASQSDTYGVGCSHVMRDLAARHPSRFWADPNLFFTDGDLVNLGADWCLMPSMFEPGGIVQQEFFVAGTPVLAFKTGGLKDTVLEWDPVTRTGNGVTFEAHNVGDFSAAVHRAIGIYHDMDTYAKLRSNARESVMDLAVVSLGWYREFHRLRRCLPPAPQAPPAEVRFFFGISAGEVPGLSNESTVELTGSFAAWAHKYPMALTSSGDRFETTLVLPPGTYQFKFVVDGVWTTAPTQPTVNDGTGNMNNVVTALAPQQEGDDDF